MRLGFAKCCITPPVGTELGGYAGYRPCDGVHDDLWCRAVVLEQGDARWALVTMDLLCVDEALYRKIVARAAHLGLTPEKTVIAAIHSHAAPVGIVPGEGPLARIDAGSTPEGAAFRKYSEQLVASAVATLEEATANLEGFWVRSAQGEIPCVGSERHTGNPAPALATVIQCRTESGKNLILYNYPCHPTVLSAANLTVSADLAWGIEQAMDGDMTVFLNGAAGDISTRFTRQGQNFGECQRLGAMAAEELKKLLETTEFSDPTPIRGQQRLVTLKARTVEPEEKALAVLQHCEAQWKAAEAAGEDPGRVRILKSYVEGAGVSLHFARTMAGIGEFHVPVSVFQLGNIQAVTVPGELFRTLLPERPVAAVCYANGYYRYLADKNAYDVGYYEAMAAIVDRGQGETLMAAVEEMLEAL